MSAITGLFQVDPRAFLDVADKVVVGLTADFEQLNTRIKALRCSSGDQLYLDEMQRQGGAIASKLQMLVTALNYVSRQPPPSTVKHVTRDEKGLITRIEERAA